MNDPEIRDLLRPLLADAFVIDELPIGYQVGDMTRADVVAIADGLTTGYEVKGDNDTLKRLPLQVRCYSRVFDRVVFVVTSKHAAKAIMLLAPFPWVGLAVAEADTVEDFKLTGKPGINMLIEPQPHNQLECEQLGALLWQKELLALLKAHGIKALTKYRCFECWELVKGIQIPALTAYVWQCVSKRWAGSDKRRQQRREANKNDREQRKEDAAQLAHRMALRAAGQW